MLIVPAALADEIADTGVTATATVTNNTLDNADSYADNPSVSYSASNAPLPYKTITPDAAASKIQGLFDKGYDLIAKTITSLAVFVFAFCCAVLLVAAIFKIEFARKVGLGGIFCAGLGLLIFYSIPFIVSFIQGVGNYLNN